MATKKPTAAQLAARKLFAQRAKAGTLKKKLARKTAVKRAKNPTTAKKTARQIPVLHRAKPNKTFGYEVVIAGSEKSLAFFMSKEKAIDYAQYYADAHDVQLAVLRK